MMNTDSSKLIYLTAAKVAQCILVADNRIENEAANKETVKNTDTWRLNLQQKWSEAFHKFQVSMNILSLSPTK